MVPISCRQPTGPHLVVEWAGTKLIVRQVPLELLVEHKFRGVGQTQIHAGGHDMDLVVTTKAAIGGAKWVRHVGGGWILTGSKGYVAKTLIPAAVVAGAPVAIKVAVCCGVLYGGYRLAKAVRRRPRNPASPCDR